VGAPTRHAADRLLLLRADVAFADRPVQPAQPDHDRDHGERGVSLAEATDGDEARERLHPLVGSQLARCGLSAAALPQDAGGWVRFLAAVGRSYAAAEGEETLAAKTRELEDTMAQLAASEAQARVVLDNAADGIVVVTTGGDLQTWNRAAERMFGYSTEEIFG